MGKTRKQDFFEIKARELCVAAGVDPDSRVEYREYPVVKDSDLPLGVNARPVKVRTQPAWCTYRDKARADHQAERAAEAAVDIAQRNFQAEQYKDAPLTIVGAHDQNTIDQMKNCMSVGNVVGGVICADGHLGYAQPVGGVIAYENQISISGVGYDIACGNMAVRLDTKFSDIQDNVATIARDIAKTISFGIGRTNEERVEHELFDDVTQWRMADREDYRTKAQAQLGTVGSGNHYVDLFHDDDGFVWIGVHFGSRGLGHTTATKYLKLAGGKDGIYALPSIVDDTSELGIRYLAGMELAGWYAYAGREWVVERVRKIVGGAVTDTIHNHHNYAWKEKVDGAYAWVVRKGATPAFPGQRGFVGGSMGDDSVILKGVDGDQSKALFHSTIHGAGRLFGRKEAKRRFDRKVMDAWIGSAGVTLIGADLDESPMAYRRLKHVLEDHAKTIDVEHVLHPFVVVMAGDKEVDPWKD